MLLDLSPAVAAGRLRGRDRVDLRERYRRGQELYFADAEPAERATVVLPW